MQSPVVSRQERLLAYGLLLAALAFNLYALSTEVTIPAPPLNDGVNHLANLQHTVSAVAAGQNPTDFWLSPITLGYPLFHYYQHLAYLPPTAVEFLSAIVLRIAPPIPALLNWFRYLLLSLFPLSVYWAMRRFGFERTASAFAALASSLIATNSLYGFDFNSYVWRGYGLYTQLWGMVLLPPALAQGYAALKTGKGYFLAVGLLAATLLSHLVLGYIALVSLILLALLNSGRDLTGLWRPVRSGGRLALLLSLTALVTVYFFLPFLTEGAYLNRSVWELPEKYDSYGYAWVLNALFSGQLFDFGRFPSLTLLAALGFAVCVCGWREERYRIPVVLFVVWLLLYFGRPTWGALLDLLPMSRDLQLHRLIAGVHLGGILLIGLGLAVPWQWAWSQPRARYLLAPLALTGLLLYPVYHERLAYLAQNAVWMMEEQTAMAAEAKDLAALMDTLQSAPPGRAYAGLARNWGKDYTVGQVPMYALLVQNGQDTVGYLYHALSLNADLQVLFDDARVEQYDLFNVRYVLTPVDWSVPAFYKTKGDFGRHRLYEIQTSGYFDLVGSDLAFTGDKRDFYPAALAWLASDLPRLKQHPAVFLGTVTPEDQQSFPLSQAAQVIAQTSAVPEQARGSIISETVESNAYLAKVNVERESVLMLKVTYHPNWRATVDGIPASTIMLMPSYIGVKVTPGVHHVRLEYQPGPQRGYLILLGLLTLALTALAEWRRESVGRLIARLKLQRLTSLIERWPRPTVDWSWLATLKQSLAPNLPYLGGLALAALLAGLPLLQLKLMSGHDTLEYLPRSVEFYESLRAGQFFPRWAPDLGGGYGAPLFNFNPPIIYYLIALFHSLGTSFIAAENMAIFALLALAGLGMYVLAGEFFGPRGGLASAVALLLAPNFLATLYVRHALADFSAFAFIPWAFWGLFRYAAGGRYRFLLIGAPAVALLLLSSNPISLISFPALALLLGWLAWTERSRPVLLRGVGCLALGLGLSAFFWLPALVERNLVHLQRLLETFFNFNNHFVYFQQLIDSPWGYGLSLPGPNDGMSFAIGPIHLGLAAVALLFLQRLRAAPNRAHGMLSFSLVMVGLAAFFSLNASAFLWEHLPLLHYLEYPWRFHSLAAVGTAFICGFPFLLLAPEQNRLANGLLATLISGLLLFNFSHANPEKFLEVTETDYLPNNIASRYIVVTTANEYEPIGVSERPQTSAPEPLTVLTGQGRALATRLSPTTREFVVEITEAARLHLNTFYFPGWTLYVDGAKQSIDHDNPQGVMEFSLGPGQHGVKFVFADTPVRLWSTRLSALALLLLLVMPWIKLQPRR